MKTPLEKVPLLQQFVNGDDAFRNSRFKLIPYISKVCMYVKKIKTVPLTLCNLLTMPIPCFFYKGSWIVKQSVGKKACLIGQQLEMNYYRGNNYLEVKLICPNYSSNHCIPLPIHSYTCFEKISSFVLTLDHQPLQRVL